MSLLVEYTLKAGMANEQTEALRTFVAGLKALEQPPIRRSRLSGDKLP